MSTIYLIESVRDYDTVYKIGYTNSNSAKRRLSELQTGNDGNLKIIFEYYTNHHTKVEKTLHNLFSHKRIKNEWFNLDLIDINNFLKTCEKLEKNFDVIQHNNLNFF